MATAIALDVTAHTAPTFRDAFEALFDSEHGRLFRYLDRLSGDAALADDLAQEAFVRLYRRGSMPDDPHAWLITVALNLFRNSRSMAARRRRLLAPHRAEAVAADPPPAPDQVADGSDAARVRQALQQLSSRDRALLLLRSEGYRYREMALALDINEASVGTLLARAKAAFVEAYDQ